MTAGQFWVLNKYQIMLICDKPTIKIVYDFLNLRICNYFLKHNWAWQKSKGFDHDTQSSRDTAHRTSSTVYVYDNLNIDFVNYTKSKVASFFNVPSVNIEPLQVQKYAPGEFYKHHHDYFFTGAEAKNNRVKTVIIYLNNNFTGGDTRFHKLDLNIAPVTGAALFFQYDYDEATNLLTEHSGEPIIEGEKYIVTAWIRESKYR